jgi:HD-GYP domain-containing protein (c-di-GMP phosphodiesterase class II)
LLPLTRDAEELKQTPTDRFNLQFRAFLRDLGKVRIPGSILNKPDKPSPDEWDVMKLHPKQSRDMIQEIGLTFMKGIVINALQHHDRFDGSGFLFGLRGNVKRRLLLSLTHLIL